VAAFGCAATPARSRVSSRADLRPPPAAGSRTLDDMLRSDLAEDHAFPWSAARRLTWEDFRGRPPTGGPEGAKTSYVLYSVWQCRGQVFEFRAVVAFRPRESWVKALVLADSVQRRTLLIHEQTHFDLGEVHARRMRQAFADLPGACRKTDAELGALADRMGQEEKDEQRRYDSETTHGLLAGPQAEWTRRTRQRLAASRRDSN
jgi:Bacterial protein of unknown function (DUF922)